MTYEINKYPAKSGRVIGEDGETHNLVDLMQGGTAASNETYDIEQYPAESGRVIGEDGQLYNIVDLLKAIVAGEGSIEDGSVTTEKLANGAVTTEKLAQAVIDLINSKVNKSGDTLSGSLKFGSNAVSDPSDLSKHIDLYDGSYGISITTYTMNFLTSTTSESTKYAFHHGEEVIGIIQTSVSDPKALTTKEYVDNVVSSKLASIEPIADPTTATVEDLANAYNALLTALKG